jgi:hypothetical protein
MSSSSEKKAPDTSLSELRGKSSPEHVNFIVLIQYYKTCSRKRASQFLLLGEVWFRQKLRYGALEGGRASAIFLILIFSPIFFTASRKGLKVSHCGRLGPNCIKVLRRDLLTQFSARRVRPGHHSPHLQKSLRTRFLTTTSHPFNYGSINVDIERPDNGNVLIA